MGCLVAVGVLHACVAARIRNGAARGGLDPPGQRTDQQQDREHRDEPTDHEDHAASVFLSPNYPPVTVYAVSELSLVPPVQTVVVAGSQLAP
jgi:hypothetical protein